MAVPRSPPNPFTECSITCCRAPACLPGICFSGRQLHAGIFVHRVAGLDPGLYVLERDRAIHDRLRACLRPTFLWERPAACLKHLPLYCLMRGNLERPARIVSCHQEIASDGAFSLGMIADFSQTIRRQGAWWYRRL